MHIKLLKHVLVGDADYMPRPPGTVVEVPDAQGKEFVAAGLADEVRAPKAKDNAKKEAAAAEQETPAAKESSESEQKEAPAPENKMAAAPANKTAKKAK